MAEQIKLKFPKKRKKTIKFGNQSIKINPIISAGVKSGMLAELQESYEKNMSEHNNLFMLVTGLYADLDILILSYCVENVDFSDAEYDELVTSGFIDLVKENIINYHDVRQTAENMIGLLYITTRMELNFPKMDNFKDMLGFDFSKFDGIEDKEKKDKIAEVLSEMQKPMQKENQNKTVILNKNEGD